MARRLGSSDPHSPTVHTASAPSAARAVTARYVQTRLWRPRGVLVQTEWSELGRLPTAEARRDYLAAHELARLLLAEWTGVEPPLLRFRPSLLGTPELIPVDPAPAPQFSLSYADGLALCVVAPCRVGVFVGSFRQVLTDPDHAAWSACPLPERRDLEKLPIAAVALVGAPAAGGALKVEEMAAG